MAGISTPSIVSVQISSSITSFTSEKKLQRGETIATLKVTLLSGSSFRFFPKGITELKKAMFKNQQIFITTLSSPAT